MAVLVSGAVSVTWSDPYTAFADVTRHEDYVVVDKYVELVIDPCILAVFYLWSVI